MLDQARGAMDSGDPARALSMLDAYGARFPHGVMGPEASMLRIEALVASGDHSAAKRAADAFLQANPTSPYASRIQTLLGPSNP
jgi:outer membrane protein assembly factor BamD (BamD/ComL family)